MSHIVSIHTQVRDEAALVAACQRLALPAPTHGQAVLYGQQEATGMLVQLPGWRYPVVCDLASGALHYDDFGGRWGQRPELDRLLQSYAVEAAKRAARRRGHSVVEEPLANGAIKLIIQTTGGVA